MDYSMIVVYKCRVRVSSLSLTGTPPQYISRWLVVCPSVEESAVTITYCIMGPGTSGKV